MYIVLLSMFIYVIIDLSNSALVGRSNQSRFWVYVMIGVLLVLTFFRLITSKQVRYNGIEIMLALNTIWIVVNNTINLNFNWATYIHIGLSLLWFLIYNFFLRYQRYSIDNRRTITGFFTVIMLIYVVVLMASSFRMRSALDRTDVVLNTAYYVLIFLPIALSCEKKWIRVVLCTALTVAVFWSFKRGAIVALFLMLCTYYFTQKKLGKIRFSLIKICGIILALLVVLFVVDTYSGGIISDRFSAENLLDGSGRDQIYHRAWAYIQSCDLSNLLIGTGAGTTENILGSSAHNEWLEFTMCYGLFGAAIYLSLYFAIFKKYLYMLRQRNSNAVYIGVLLTYLVTVSMYGAIYFIQSTVFVMAMLGLFSKNYEEQ